MSKNHCDDCGNAWHECECDDNAPKGCPGPDPGDAENGPVGIVPCCPEHFPEAFPEGEFEPHCVKCQNEWPHDGDHVMEGQE